ncbi:hypothetical protein Forpi1262_v016727 [Fusarium oxysporum f. sp. raphani]|uniref:Endonuclease/exonuclease/phosphatase domain-containing protein n=1 Tax=Fusarium oxysporum f. sp. raphani TaxID=96318 RepID=A0A8J5PDW5_FUSOX|nr:hypothetical protein Forpi1262_v016727 [Fusarium oxysporum f. sp. raphani]
MGTSRRPRARRCEKKTLRVFQANVGKIPPVHDCALALADSERYDIVLLQEPWTTTANSRCLTKTHPAYDTYSPVETWHSNSTRPRVMTYVRRDSTLSADQNRPYQSRDILWLTVNDTIIVNFYRQNDERDALDTLLQWPIPDRCLVAGDFNARHHTWQTGPTTNRGHEIASWASENGLGLLNTSDIPTNPHGNTIDLAFSNVPLAEANVEDHLATSSDHFTLSLTLPNVEPAPTQPGKIRVTTDDELKRFVEIVELGSTAIPVAASSPLELDKLASTLVSLLQSAAKAAGRPARKGARNTPWWTEECALAAAGYRAIRRLYPLGFNQEVQIAKRDFHRVVRRAKRLYWRNLINSFSDSSSVFKAVRWLRSPGAFQPPPLQVDDVVYETQLDKANALRRATLERRTAEDDIQDPWIELIKRKYQAPTESSFRTRLRRTNELLAPCPRPALMQKRFGKGQDTPLQTAPKGESAEAFLQWIETVEPATWIVYSDGSLSSEGAASYGFAIHQKDLSICDGSGRLGPAEAHQNLTTSHPSPLQDFPVNTTLSRQPVVGMTSNSAVQM